MPIRHTLSTVAPGVSAEGTEPLARSISGHSISDSTYLKLQGDLRRTERAILIRGLFRWRRLHPKKYVVLEPIYSPEAVTAAKADGSLFAEVKA